MQDTDALAEFLVPAPTSLLTLYPITTAVNHVRNKGAELIVPLSDSPTEGQLSL